jgi:hypothetical protein
MTETIDAEIVETTDLATRPTAAPTLFGTDQPDLIIAKAAGIAKVLKKVITDQKMAIRIGSSEYIKVEGWTTLGALLGVFPKVEYTRELTDGEGVSEGWEAAVVVVNSQGVEIGRAEAECLRAEKNWKGRDDFALRSMAQTRAMGKALRMPLGWIAVMSGFEATPAEEMPAQAPAPKDDIPFSPATPATPSPEEQWVADQQDEAVKAVLELAARVDQDTADKTAAAIEAHRKKHGKVDPAWLGKLRAALEKKQPEPESTFQIPEAAKA